MADKDLSGRLARLLKENSNLRSITFQNRNKFNEEYIKIYFDFFKDFEFINFKEKTCEES